MIEDDLGPSGPRGIPYTDNYSVLSQSDTPTGPKVKQFLTDQRGTARIIAVTGYWCTDLGAACPVQPPLSLIARPGFEVTVIVGE